MRVRIVCKQLEPGITIYSLRARPGDRIVERVRRNHARIWVAKWTVDLHGVCCRGVLGLQAVARFAEMQGVRADVAYLEDPLTAQRMLHRQIPLLCAGHNEMSRYLQPEDIG